MIYNGRSHNRMFLSEMKQSAILTACAGVFEVKKMGGSYKQTAGRNYNSFAPVGNKQMAGYNY